MRRLAFIDALAVATFLLCLTSLGTFVDSVWTPEAYAGMIVQDATCSGPAISPGTSGSCTGCVGSGQTGTCSSSPGLKCISSRDYCTGTISGELTPCNCSTNGCA